jgi:hypothetical protein
MVNRPVKLLIAAGVLLALIGFQRSLWFVIAAPLGWIAGWCWWSYAAPKWRTWAISRGTDPRALQYYAEKGNLLWPKGHWGERTEFGRRALREAQQPVEPFRGDATTPLAEPGTSEFAPGFFAPASNRSFLMGVVFWTIGMPLGRWLTSGFIERDSPYHETLFTGLLTGILLAAITYTRKNWRAAVSPEHAFGLGMLGMCLVIVLLTTGNTPPRTVQIVFGALFLIAPGYLMVRSVMEWRLRRRPLRD